MPFDPLKEYSAGLRGAFSDPRSDEEFEDSILRAGGNPDGGEVAHQWEFAGRGEGKLTMLFPEAMTVFPDYLPGPAQLTGDCVARACAACIACTTAIEIITGEPDPQTGKVEGPPDLPRQGITQGVIAPESLWAWRGYDSDGWICSKAAQVACEKGFLLRKPYPELGFDLTKYTNKTLRLGGSRAPGSEWLAESKKHVVRTATNVRGREEVRDFIAQGYCIFNCSSLGFSRTRDENGFSRQSGTWQHAQHFLAYDERPEIVRIYGQPLVLWQNSWSRWNSGPRRVRGTNVDIPEGAFWALASTIDRCRCIALSDVAGWPPRKLKSYGASGNI
jgi:hypothetical protein